MLSWWNELSWLLQVGLVVTIIFGLTLLSFISCWWFVLNRTIQRFNREVDHHV